MLADEFDVGYERSQGDYTSFGLSDFQKHEFAISWDWEDSPRSRFVEWVGKRNKEWMIFNKNAAL